MLKTSILQNISPTVFWPTVYFISKWLKIERILQLWNGASNLQQVLQMDLSKWFQMFPLNRRCKFWPYFATSCYLFIYLFLKYNSYGVRITRIIGSRGCRPHYVRFHMVGFTPPVILSFPLAGWLCFRMYFKFLYYVFRCLTFAVANHKSLYVVSDIGSLIWSIWKESRTHSSL